VKKIHSPEVRWSFFGGKQKNQKNFKNLLQFKMKYVIIHAEYSVMLFGAGFSARPAPNFWEKHTTENFTRGAYHAEDG
jgi:hypothetical protein